MATTLESFPYNGEINSEPGQCATKLAWARVGMCWSSITLFSMQDIITAETSQCLSSYAKKKTLLGSVWDPEVSGF